jgi:hypothetical protein
VPGGPRGPRRRVRHRAGTGGFLNLYRFSKEVVRIIGLRPARGRRLIGDDGHTRADDPSWATFWTSQRGGKWEFELLGSEHVSFSDLEYLSPQVLPLLDVPADQMPPTIGVLAPDRTRVVQERYLSAFFTKQLGHRHSGLLDGPSPRFPGMAFLP